MTYLRQTITKALAVIAVLFAGCMTASADTVTESFDGDEFPAGWSLVGTNIYWDDQRARTGAERNLIVCEILLGLHTT